MPNRLKIIVAYDGAPFAGWQSQTNGNAIQDHLEKAFAHITLQPVRVHGAGRTDAGVHALGQCAHVELPSGRLTPERWLTALNGSLPATIRVLRCGYVNERFHARYSAKGKLYRYRIWNDQVLPPHENGRAWQVRVPLDFEAMSLAAREFCGRHDFASFAANRGRPEANTHRSLDAVRLRRKGRCLELELSGEGFLYKMVRLIAGAVVRCGLNQSSPDAIRNRLLSPDQASGGARFAAPAAGLFLVRVRY